MNTVVYIVVTVLIVACVFRAINKKKFICVGGKFDRSRFNSLFVEANQALTKGDTEALKKGIGLLMEAMDCAGDVYANDLVKAITNLRCALSHHDHADTKGPWNRDLSGYGVLSWKDDLWNRDTALGLAWPHIKAINEDLKKHGLGWNY